MPQKDADFFLKNKQKKYKDETFNINNHSVIFYFNRLTSAGLAGLRRAQWLFVFDVENVG